jgi:hypothetical protein
MDKKRRRKNKRQKALALLDVLTEEASVSILLFFSLGGEREKEEKS